MSMGDAGKITIVPTPIGNRGDMTLRALEALREADVVCAEDTRVTGGLLAGLDISKRLERLDENALDQRAADVVARAAAGARIAYCSDAGMPGVSDPGLRLVLAAREAGVDVEVLPGASAVTTAYVASGTVCPRFYFGGFFPRKSGERERVLEGLRTLDAALVFYESPHRLCDALEAIARAYPARQVAVCRELTKLHEEVVRDTAVRLCAQFNERTQVKGEIVLVIDAPAAAEGEPDVAAAQELARALVASGASVQEVRRALQEQAGLSRNAAYAMALETARD
ncbi:16S rRNA (cytidine(1402)-2'-O)-methyltransferase [Adlercreutzia murintestinalis]|uniref:16S rRNA (cytidine(1402)-2'-O)-methyltransferase n=1 Tax=Adlercreutzia murintestinalis TaxID=2941325 RepID=UPI00203B4FBE|nr:16S rRNA (cytidine(1402)-2'-O)-methyltransferase [Adlercreutzia murintestinalis]